MESMILHEIEQMCKALTTNQPIDLTRKTNLAVVNCLWLIIAGQRYDFNDQRFTVFENIQKYLILLHLALFSNSRFISVGAF